MFQPQQSQSSHRKTHIMAPTVASQNEAQAKEKLSGYVYEYLVHVGAPKAAEVFKSELLSQQNLSQIAPGDPPGFLHNWWCVFWDLYSAAPERKNKYDPSQEAKAFHEYGFIPPSTFVPGSLMNGVHPVLQFGNGAPGLGPMGIQSNADGIVPNYFAGRGGNQPVPSAVPSNQASPIAGGPRYMGSHPGAGPRSGAPTPSNVINNAGGSVSTNFPSGTSAAHMFANDQQMRNMVAAQRMNSNSVRMPNFPQQMRHIRPGCPSGFPSASGQFLDSPSGTPPFSQNLGMLPNGMCSAASLLSSPGGQTSGVNGIPGSVGAPPSNIDPSSHDPRFMMMAGGSAQFSLNHHDGAGTPTSCAGSGVSTSVPSGFNGMQLNSVVAGANAPDGTNPSVSGIGGQFQSLLNGGGDVSGIDMKQSPISHMNGSTPGGGHTNPGSIQQQQQQGGGPASVHGCHGDPGSVHSQPGGLAPGSVLGVAGPNSQQATQPHQTPTSDSSQSAAMDFQPSVPTSNSGGGDDEMEISKIKASLIEGFGPGSGSFGSV